MRVARQLPADGERLLQRDYDRAERLLVFVRQELTYMDVKARFEFANGMTSYLKPEIQELLNQGKLWMINS